MIGRLAYLVAFLWCLPALAGGMMPDIVFSTPNITSYSGPLDIVSSATVCYSLRACGSAKLGGTTKSVNLRRASDNTTCDFDINTSGNLGGTDSGCGTGAGLSLATFATQDATATCTIATTTATCTGGSSVSHSGSTITGSGLTQPCYASAAGSGTSASFTVTVAGAGGSSPCGTVSVGETLTFTYGLYAATWYDQANTNNATQATAGSQPELMPTCLNGLPCLLFAGAQKLGTTVTVAQPFTIPAVGERTGAFTSQNAIWWSSGALVGWQSTTSTALEYAGTVTTKAAADSAAHSFAFVLNSASSVIVVDGAGTTVNPGTGGFASGANIGESNSSADPLSGLLTELGLWGSAFNPTQYGSMRSNQSAYWGTP